MNVMNADWKLVQELFEELVEAPPEKRELLMASYAPSPEVMAEALALFAANEALVEADLLETELAEAEMKAALKPSVEAPKEMPVDAVELKPEPVVAPEAAVVEAVAPVAAPAAPLKGSVPLGTQLGPYRIKSLLGKSGHNELYAARQSEGGDDRRVVVRLLPREHAARFDWARPERQLLMGLVHPGIVSLGQGGKMPDGRPYLVSDFIEGEPLLAHVARKKLSLKNRLKLVLDICEAVSYGHRQLLVHEDLKPAHVLVTSAGKIKLVDYGLAQMIGGGAPGEERVVSVSTQAYAAPEYLKGARATVATDVYGLGAILFELLTGVAPWLTGGKDSSAVAARLLNSEPPLVSTIKAVEPTVPAIDAKLLAGDIDAIVARALRQDPAARYESAAALAEDITRAMRLRPVLARGSNVIYRSGRFLRRNRIALAASVALVVAGGVAFIGADTFLATRSNGPDVQIARVETARDLMTMVVRSAISGQVAGYSTVREVLDRTVHQIQAEPSSLATPPEVLLAVGQTYLELEEFDGASAMLQRYRDTAAKAKDAEGEAQADMLLAAAAVGSGEKDEARTRLEAAQAYWASAPRRHLEQQAELDGYRAALMAQNGRRSDAVELLRNAIARLEAARRDKTLVAANLQHTLGQQLLEQGQLGDAAKAFDTSGTLLKALGRENAPAALSLEASKALLAHARGEWGEASARWEDVISRRRALYGASDSLASVQLSFGRALLARGEPMPARLRFNDALSMVSSGTTQSSTVYAMLLQSRGLANLGAGDLRAAEQDLKKALDVAETLFGDKSLYYGMAVMAHAEMSFMRRDIDRARRDIAIAEPIFAMSGPAGAEQQKALTAIKKIILSADHLARTDETAQLAP